MKKNNPIIALVDDDKIYQLITLRTIANTDISDDVLQFENGEDAITFLKEHASSADKLPDYIFLDINMPYMDGWMFLDEFETLKHTITKEITIFMVSSSIDPRDIERASNHPQITQYVIKPISIEKFKELLSHAA
jgi:two-component system chemotaxis response regulator CheY